MNTAAIQFGPEIMLGRRFADLHSSESGTRVALIKYANGGTSLFSDWKSGGDASATDDGPEYVIFQQTVTSGLAALAAGLAEPDADRDGDGQSNRQEFLATSNPLSPTSGFTANFHRPTPTLGQITYDSSSARMYEIQRYDKTSRTWLPALHALRDTGSAVTPSVELSGPKSLFRVGASLP